MLLVDLPSITRAAIALVTPLAHATPDAIVAALKPRDGDYDQVFVGSAAKHAREGYASMWASPPKGLAKPGQTIVSGSAAQAQTLGTDNEQSRQFPGGYRRIAHLLTPNLVWVRWDYREPGADGGMAYDGLVQLGDRWAWFPKPWRVIDTAS